MDQNLQNQDNSWHIGQKILIAEGPFAGMEGVIYWIDRREQIVRLKIDVIGRPTPVELPFSSLKTLD